MPKFMGNTSTDNLSALEEPPKAYGLNSMRTPKKNEEDMQPIASKVMSMTIKSKTSPANLKGDSKHSEGSEDPKTPTLRQEKPKKMTTEQFVRELSK